jgi:N-6 DNA Methylase
MRKRRQAGRAAVVLDTGAASRGSGNANNNKEKEVRRWFVEEDVIEGVIYLPENLFYNTSAPGIVIILDKAKPKERKGKLFLLNAGREFEKGDPKNYLPPMPSLASLTRLPRGKKSRNTRALSPAKRSPRMTSISLRVATFILPRAKSIVPLPRLLRSWKL